MSRYWKVQKITPEEVLDSLYNKAYTMGADAIVRFDLESVIYNNGDVNYYSLQASGFAIKRIGEFKKYD
jgi:uncharacterized protein YbjQ (UPF0145 family)